MPITRKGLQSCLEKAGFRQANDYTGSKQDWESGSSYLEKTDIYCLEQEFDKLLEIARLEGLLDYVDQRYLPKDVAVWRKRLAELKGSK